MSYDEKFGEKLRNALAHLPKVSEKKMFGSLAFMVNDKMCVAAGNGRLMCRIDPEKHDELVKQEGCQTVVMGGRAYKGYIYVEQESLQSKKAFDYWIKLSLDFNKKAKSSKK